MINLIYRNHNVTEAQFFRLVGVDNTADFYVEPGEIFTHTFTVIIYIRIDHKITKFYSINSYLIYQ